MLTLKNSSNTFPDSNGAVFLANLANILTGLKAGVLSGLTLSNNGTDATNDIDCSSGSAKDSTGQVLLSLSATHVKQLDATFAEYSAIGTASGGRDSADNLTGAKWFRVWLIGGSGKNDQIFFSTSATPTLPSGFTHRGQIGWIYWNGSAIKLFTMRGDIVRWSGGVLDIDATNPGTSAVLAAVTVPPLMEGIYNLGLITQAGGASSLYVSDPAASDEAPSTSASPLASLRANASETRNVGPVRIRTNASSQVRYRVSFSEASMKAQVCTLGFIGRGDV